MSSAQPTEDQLRQEQDHAQLLSLLREQENLARMEELRSRQELEEFIADLEHEKRTKAALRQNELDQLWGHLAERSHEEAMRRRLEQLRLARDAQAIRSEIEELKLEMDRRRQRRDELRQEIATAAGRQLAPQAEARGATESMQARHEMNAETGLASAEWALMARMDERLEGLVSSMERILSAETPDPTVATAESVINVILPPLRFVPAGIIVASKGVARIDAWPPSNRERPRTLKGYNSSTRSLCVTRHPEGEVPILLAGHRRGVTHLDPGTGGVIANYPLSEGKRYAVNASGFAPDGRLLATHSELGLVAWHAPERRPHHLSGDIRSARLLRFLEGDGGALYASDDVLMRYDIKNDSHHVVRELHGRVITSLEVAVQYAVVGDNRGAVSVIELQNPEREIRPLLAGEKVYTVGVLDWQGTTWVAAGVKRNTGAYLMLYDLHGHLPELMLNIPERIHTIRRGGPGILLAASERFLSYWNLNRSHQSHVVSLGEVAPVQDFALVR